MVWICVGRFVGVLFVVVWVVVVVRIVNISDMMGFFFGFVV